MTHLINKDVLVAEIENYISAYRELLAKTDRNDQVWIDFVSQVESKINVLQHLLIFLDTLEAKEIDLKEESESIADDIMMKVQANKYHTHVYSTTRCDFNHSHLMLAAGKGIALGLKVAQNEHKSCTTDE